MFTLPHHRSRVHLTAAGEHFAVALRPEGGVPTQRLRQAMKGSASPPIHGQGSIADLTRSGFEAIRSCMLIAAFHVDADGNPIVQRGLKIRGRCHPVILNIDASTGLSAPVLPAAYDPQLAAIRLAQGMNERAGPILAERVCREVEQLRSELIHQQRQALHAMTSRWMTMLATAAEAIAMYRSAA